MLRDLRLPGPSAMHRLLAIADDLSGAAEIAGIAHRFGLPARIRREPVDGPSDGLIVLDTDSRSMHPCEAQRTVSDLIRGLRREDFDLVYKKTDSVFRGNIAAEV